MYNGYYQDILGLLNVKVVTFFDSNLTKIGMKLVKIWTKIKHFWLKIWKKSLMLNRVRVPGPKLGHQLM